VRRVLDDAPPTPPWILCMICRTGITAMEGLEITAARVIHGRWRRLAAEETARDTARRAATGDAKPWPPDIKQAARRGRAHREDDARADDRGRRRSDAVDVISTAGGRAEHLDL
jgi:hypothetical protein